MPRQSQALRLAIKQATNAKPVSQANKPQKIIVQANITRQQCHVGIERFHFEYDSSCFRHNQKTVSADNACPRPIVVEKGQGRRLPTLPIHDHSQARDRQSFDARAKYQNRSRLENYRRYNPQSANRRSRLLRRNRASWADDQSEPRRAARAPSRPPQSKDTLSQASLQQPKATRRLAAAFTRKPRREHLHLGAQTRPRVSDHRLRDGT